MPNDQPQLFYDYYTFQFMDGSWRIAPTTAHCWNGEPDLPRDVLDSIHLTGAHARAMLAQFAARALAAS